MAYALKKLHVAIATLLLIAVGQVYGDDSHSTADTDDVDGHSCKSACGGKGFISADLLYWRVIEGGVDASFPFENIDYISSDGNTISKSRIKDNDPHFNWSPGFRLTTGYEFTGGWNVAAVWTHLYSHANRHYRNVHGFRNKYENRWRINFEVIDLVAGYKLNSSSSFTLMPFAGLRGAQIKQKLRTIVLSEVETVDSSSEIFSSYLNPENYLINDLTRSSAHNKQRFFGIGPVIGVLADWDLGSGFKVYANASVSGLYGYTHVRLNALDTVTNVADFSTIKKRLSIWQGVVDLGVGLRWYTHLYGSLFWLQLGLEHHVYLGHNHIAVYGDLSLDGANFSVGFAF